MQRRKVFLAVAALGATFVVAQPAAAEAAAPLPDPTVHAIQFTGPPAERLNLIILGDGYQADQQSLFLADVDRNLAVMWATEPFLSRTGATTRSPAALSTAARRSTARASPTGTRRA